MLRSPNADNVAEAGPPGSPGASALRLFAVAAGLLLPIAYSTSVYASFWTPKAAFLVVIVGVGTPLLVGLATKRDRAAVAALAFLAIAAISAVMTDEVALSTFGLYNNGLGLVFFAGIFGAWALGRGLSDTATSWLLAAALVGVAINVVVALAQTVFDLAAWQLGRPLGRADGLVGNPVHLGALTAAGVVTGVYVWVRDRRWWALSVIVSSACALQLSGSRFALVVAAGGALAMSRRDRLRRSAVSAVLLVVGLLAGSLVATAADDVDTGTARVSASVASGLTPRTEIWRAAAQAAVELPIIGWGPGRFREATGSRRSLKLALAEGPEAQFLDAHNLVVELAVTTGVFGLAAFAAFLALAVRRGRGPLLVFALASLSLTLVQPLNVSTVPLALLCLGAATSERGPPPFRLRVASFITGAASAAVAGVLVFSDIARLDAELDFDLARARRVDALTPPWPENAELIGRIYLFRALIPNPDDPALTKVALGWRVRAAERDPSDSRSWTEVGELALKVPDRQLAESAFERALDANPHSARAFLGLGETSSAEGDWAKAVAAYEEALRREPVPSNRAFIERRLARAEQELDRTDA